MKLKTFAATLFSLALVASGTPPPAAAQQVITLENGDRISGTLRAVVDGAWRFSFLGSEQEIPAAEILSVTSEVPFGLRLSDGSIVTATFAEAEDAIRLNFDDGTSTTVSPSDIVAIGPPDDLAAVAPLEIGLFSPLLRFWKPGLRHPYVVGWPVFYRRRRFSRHRPQYRRRRHRAFGRRR